MSPWASLRLDAIELLEVVHTKNSVRPTNYIIWRGKVMDLARLDDRRPAIESRVRSMTQDSFVGQVSAWVSITLGL